MSADSKRKSQAISAATASRGPASPRRLPGLRKDEGYTLHPFDLRYGTRTSGLVAGRNLKTGHLHDRHTTAYGGVAPSVLAALLRRWRRLPPQAAPQSYTFLDIGAGMGRAVLLAASMPFRRVCGVELHPTLSAQARRNLRLWRAQGRELAPARIHCADAVPFPLPPGPILAFLFNPFGATVMRRLLAAWRRQLIARPRPLDILYVNHEQEGVLEAAPGFRRLFLGPVARSRADAIADHRILANQPDGEYASSNSEDCSIWRWRALEPLLPPANRRKSHQNKRITAFQRNN
jgi:SAM-dependent methyltransferase